MCGLTGILRFHGALTASDIEALSVMTDAIAHRGPDGSGQWHDNHTALGHRRLSILDLSAEGAQPMRSKNGRFIIAYNGEIYNFEDLRSKLEKEGVRFRSASDTEVMLEAFSHWGIEKSLKQFNGMFAFALWDIQEKRLTLARDQIGMKPLFWACIPGGILFGSEIKSLKKHPSFNNEINENALGEYFSRTYIVAPQTIYKDCFRLPSGHFIHCTHDGNINSWNFQPKHELSFEPGDLSEKTLANALETELKRSLNRHMRADVPVAAFLSGGNDSALIAALLADSQNFSTYSIGYDDNQYDESARARTIASHLGISHETIIIRPDDAINVIGRLHEFYDEPFADASAIPTYILSKHVKLYAKAALSGDGADELFSGYPRYIRAVNEWKRISCIPRMIRPLLSALLPKKPPHWLVCMTKPMLSNPAESIPYLKNILSQPTILSYFLSQNHIGIPECILKDFSLVQATSDDIKKIKIHNSSLRSLLSYDQAVRLPDGMLTKVDRASMAASLEVRLPFLDRDIIAFSRAIQDRSLVSDSMQLKKPIKDILKRYIPDSLVTAPKMGFHIPMKIWLRDHFSDWAQDLLEGQEDPYIDLHEARRLWDEYANHDRDDLFYGLWCIIMYRQWARAAEINL